MSGVLVNCTWQDSVRIRHTHKALTIPASLVIDVDDNLREVRIEGSALVVYRVEEVWFAECGGTLRGTGCSPIQAIANMERRSRDEPL